MLFFMAWGARPDAAVWRGRRLLAVLDAVAWPAAAVTVVVAGSGHFGVVGLVVAALAPVLALRRAWRAVFRNHRYVFTTWRVACPLLLLGVIGLTLKAIVVAVA